ncbi:MAG: TIGR02594 family protein [Bacteroidia bacterium]|nr:TIGR02594 family protein [Bacteroidia bacterium]
MSEDTSSSSKEPLMSTVEDNVSSSETANSSSQSTSSQSTTSSGGSTTAPAANTSTKKEDSGIVTVSSLNVRKGPGGEFDKNGPALTSGSKVDIFQEENGWYRIGPDMWVSAKYVRVGALIPDNAGGKPPWLSVAEGEIGVTEIAGSKHNPRVIEYHSTTGGFKDDETPWCASFVTWVLKSAGKSSTGSASALSYRSYGTKLDKPAYGAIAVFSHGGGKGHVGFVVGKQGDKILVLGGNQSNMVKVSAYDTGKVVAYVVPSDYEVPASAYTLLGMTDKLETEGYAQTR